MPDLCVLSKLTRPDPARTRWYKRADVLEHFRRRITLRPRFVSGNFPILIFDLPPAPRSLRAARHRWKGKCRHLTRPCCDCGLKDCGFLPNRKIHDKSAFDTVPGRSCYEYDLSLAVMAMNYLLSIGGKGLRNSFS